MQPDRDEPCFVISVAAKLLDIHPQTLRYYERLGFVSPSRSNGKIRLYSASDIERLRRVQRLVNDLGVNLAGVEVILRLQSQIEEREREASRAQAQLEAEIGVLRAALAERGRPRLQLGGGERAAGRTDERRAER